MRPGANPEMSCAEKDFFNWQVRVCRLKVGLFLFVGSGLTSFISLTKLLTAIWGLLYIETSKHGLLCIPVLCVGTERRDIRSRMPGKGFVRLFCLENHGLGHYNREKARLRTAEKRNGI